MSRLTQIDDALTLVRLARGRCPFSTAYRGRAIHSATMVCSECHADRRGDGGRCVIDRAEHDAVLSIEEAIA